MESGSYVSGLSSEQDDLVELRHVSEEVVDSRSFSSSPTVINLSID